MKIVILGAGDSGKLLSTNLSTDRHDITIIDESESLVSSLNELLDVGTVCGDGSKATVLAEANVAEAALFIALANDEQVNVLAASVAKAMGAKKTIARVSVAMEQCQWLFDYRTHFGIDYLFSSERITAIETSKFILNPEEPMIEQIGRGRIKVQQAAVSAESKLTGTPINRLSLPPKVRIAVIHRGNKVIIPKGDHVLEAGDQLTLFGEQAKVGELAQVLKSSTIKEKVRKVTIYGGGDYGFALALLLNHELCKVRIIDADPQVCAALSKTLPDAVVIQGDARSVQLLQEEQIELSDFYIGASLDDEGNVMACLQARNMGVEHVIPIIHNADNSAVVDQNRRRLGFSATVSPRQVTSSDLLRFVESAEFHSVGHFSNDVELVQFTVNQKASIVGKRVGEVAWPDGSSLVAFLRDENVIVPDGNEGVEAGDSIYAVVLPEVRKRLLKLLSA